MKLVIVESPSKAKTIGKYLGEDFTVRASVGHIRDLPKSNKKAIDIEDGYAPHYEIVPGKEEIVSELSMLADKASEVILATDPDREGEAIAWHIKEALGLKKPQRITFNEITKTAVLEAMEKPRTIDTNLRKAQEARRVLDRLVGYDLSGLIWKKVRYGLSAGRVQSPALRILAEREREIQQFVPKAYIVLSAIVETDKKEKIEVTYPEDLFDLKLANKIHKESDEKKWNVASVESTSVKREPRTPFTTSTLQQAASTVYGFSPSRTMGIAQKLYEAGHITYMRTDSPNISVQASAQICSYVEKNFGKNYVEPRTFKAKSKNAQEAHEAVRPSDIYKEKAGNNDDQKKLYSLIWRRSVAAFMAPAEMLRTTIMAHPASHSEHAYKAVGSRVVFDGWRKVMTDDDTENILPECKANDALSLDTLNKLEKETQPPGRYSEAGLVKELEKRGIGRPSTYASIIRTLEERGYVTKEQRSLQPTDTGMVVSGFLEGQFAEYISDSFTAKMEDSLDDIADGAKEYSPTIDEYYKPLHAEVLKASKNASKITNLGDAPAEFPCPICGNPMVYKLSRSGRFMSCARFPECTGARTAEGAIIEPDSPIGVHPESGLSIFVKTGRFGPYVQVGEDAPKVKKPAKKRVKKAAAAEGEQPAETAVIAPEAAPAETPAPTPEKPKRASIPKEVDPSTVTVEMALKYLSLPRTLGLHPVKQVPVTVTIGRFGPYIACDGEFRSVKAPDDVYTISLERALELLAQEKKGRGRKGGFKKKAV